VGNASPTWLAPASVHWQGKIGIMYGLSATKGTEMADAESACRIPHLVVAALEILDKDACWWSPVPERTARFSKP
jgi:hypothetical protein